MRKPLPRGRRKPAPPKTVVRPRKRVQLPTKAERAAQRAGRRQPLAPPIEPERPTRRALVPPVPPEPAEPRDDVRDAARWRALLSSERIRVATTIHQPHSNPIEGARYLQLELWSHSTVQETRMSKHLLVEYADFVREINGDD